MKTIKLNTMSKEQKITTEELTIIKEKQEAVNGLLSNIGYLEAQKHSALHQLSEVNTEVEKNKVELEDKYGGISISIGSDYKNDAMHYAVNQQVYGGHIIKAILHDETDNSYSIYIKKNEEVLPWKKFNCNMAVSVEYDLEY